MNVLPFGKEGGVDYDGLWSSGVRVLLRRGVNQKAKSEAKASAEAAKAAANAAQAAAEAAESGDAEAAAKAAEEALRIAQAGLMVAKEEMEEVRSDEERSDSKRIIPLSYIMNNLPLVASLLASPIIPTLLRFASLIADHGY